MAFEVIICILLDRLFILMVMALLIFTVHLYIGEKDLRLIFVIPPFVHLLLKVYIKLQMLINIYFAFSPGSMPTPFLPLSFLGGFFFLSSKGPHETWNQGTGKQQLILANPWPGLSPRS